MAGFRAREDIVRSELGGGIFLYSCGLCGRRIGAGWEAKGHRGGQL